MSNNNEPIKWHDLVEQVRNDHLISMGIDPTDSVATSEYWNTGTNYRIKWDLEEEANTIYQDSLSDLASQYDSVANIYTKADRILANQDIEVVISPANRDMDSVASNNGSVIAMNPKLLDNINDTSVVAMNGVNYHELAHALYSPRSGSELGKWVATHVVHFGRMVTPRYQLAFNTLEEGRIETLLTTKYPSTRYFLESAVSTYAIDTKDPDSIPNAFYITRGRRHLDMDLRQRIAELYVDKYGVEQALAVAEIIDEYRTLAFPNDSQRAKELIMRMYEYVGSTPPKNGGCGGRKVMRGGRPAKGSEQVRLQAEAREGEGESEPIKPSDNKPDNKDKDNDKPSKGAGDSDTPDVVVPQKDFSGLDDIVALINERAEAISKLPQVKAETKTVMKAINGDGVGNNLRKDTAFTYYSNIDPAFRHASNMFGTELERLRVDNDPEWEKERPSGKLNIPRTMNAGINDLPRLFDKWSQGNDNCDIESVIMLDRSGSMGGQIDQASQAVWAIKRGLERINANVTAMTFNHVSRNVYMSDEKAKPNEYKSLKSSGGTDPIEGLRTSLRLFRASAKPTKLLFIVTDGTWGNEKDNDLLVKTLMNEGVVVCIVYLGSIYTDHITDLNDKRQYLDDEIKRLGHGATHFTAVAKPADLVGVARRVVKDQLSVRH